MIAQDLKTRMQVKRQLPDQGRFSLSLAIAPDSFSYALSENQFREPLELLAVTSAADERTSSLADAFEFFINNNRLTNQHFEKVVINLLSPDFTLLPAAFAGTQATKILDFVNGRNNKKHIIHHLQGMELLAGVDQELIAVLERHFPAASIRHAGAVSISLFFSQHSLTGATVFLNCVGNHMELMARKDSHLLFYNIFTHQSDEDILYYLLFALKQFGIDPAHCHLAVAGDRIVSDPLFATISRYVGQLSYCAHDASLTLKGDFVKLPSHCYFHVLNQHLCEL